MKMKECVAEEPVLAENALPFDGIPLEVTEVKPGLHERAEGIENRPVYRLCWPRLPRRTLGPLPLPVGTTRCGAYIKLSPERINLSDEAVLRRRQASAHALTDETAVFLRTRLGNTRLELILANRYHSRWSVIHRWTDTWRGLGISRMDVIN
jgi:hypothetical protein